MELEEVRTVTGSIYANDLGITLSHEHVLSDLTCYFKETMASRELPASKVHLIDAPICMKNLGELRRDSAVRALSRENLVLGDLNEAVEEVMQLRIAGGKSLVELTTIGLGRDPIGLRAVSFATGVNIICATGWYREISHPLGVREKSVDQLADAMIRDLTDEIPRTGIRAGIIGELGTSVPLSVHELKVLQAGGRAQKKTWAPLTIHIQYLDLREGVVKKAGEYLDLIAREGANLSKVYLSHMDLSCSDLEYHRSIIENYDVILSYDTFGMEGYVDSSVSNITQPPDAQRVKAIAELTKSGYEEHLMLSSDICAKIFYKRYGNYGYAHVLEHIVPSLRLEGVSKRQINTMLIDNPKRILAW